MPVILGLLAICLVLVFAAPGLCIPRIVLGCVYEAERKRQLPTQFMMTDLMWLMLLIQVPMVPLRFIDRGDPTAVPLYLFVLIAVPLVWWHSLRVLSRAGVLGFWRRGLFLTVVVPLTLVLTVAGGICGASLTTWLFAVVQYFYDGSLGGFGSWRMLTMQVLGIIGIVISVCVLRKAAQYALKTATSDVLEPKPDR